MKYSIKPITPKNAQEISSWAYDPPYERYDMSADHIQGLLNPDYRYHVVFNGDQILVGFCCFGEDARVPGGSYSIIEPKILDVGVGMHPKFTGQGLGWEFVGFILDYTFQSFRPKIFRVTVAAFNQRSLKTFKSLGFIETHSFFHDLVEIKFIQLERPVNVEVSNDLQ
ncbi:MAG: GNAT family N-acetyltransferase [Anaerolineales bacterium]|nr:GNAT family N-acetyltransferase [Anaerolineales bacterium]